MKRICAALLFCLVVASTADLKAADLRVNFEPEAKIVSDFVWRGRMINDEPCFQPSITAQASDFTMNLSGSWNLTSQSSNSWQNGRIDAMFYYDYVYQKGILRPGFSAYIYHDDPAGQAKDTYEWFIGYIYDSTLLPTLVLYYDFSKMDGFFATFSLSRSFIVVKDKADIDLKLQLEAADKNYNNALFSYPFADDRSTVVPDKSGLVDLWFKVSVPVKVWKNCTLTPEVKFVTLLDSEIRDIVEASGDKADMFVYGLSFSAQF